MKIQTLTNNLNIENLDYNSVNGGNKNSKYSNKCKVSILVLHNPYTKPFVMISADLLWFSEDIVKNVKTKAIQLYNTISNNIVFCASHTHGTPNPNKNILYGKPSDNFAEYIEKNIIVLLKEGLKCKKIPIELNSLNLNAPNVTISRRRNALQFNKFPLKAMQSLPNYNKLVDKSINLIEFKNLITKKIECIIIKHTCHPVADPHGVKGADYPGYLKKELANGTCNNIIFLQGFCGDIRPKVIKNNKTIKDKIIKIIIGDRFRKTKEGDAKFIANELKKSIEKNIYKKNKTFITGPMKSFSKKLKIKLENNLIAPRDIEFTIWIWDKTCFIFINAEVLSGYIFNNINELNIINVGYTNGMFGYLPTKKDIQEGGYEVDKSRIAFGIENRIMKDTEIKIKDEIIKQIKIMTN